MCMLFIKESGLQLPQEYFDSLWDHNPHGLSAWNLSSKELFKTLDEVEAKEYLDANKDSKLIVHFRLATSGLKTLDQLHGFDVANGEWALFHNGVLKTFHGNSTLSDTQQLAEFFQNKTPEEMVAYLERYETSSRFLLVEKATGKILKPVCAVWCAVQQIDGIDLEFSNTYAVDRKFLPESERTYYGYGYYNTSYKSNKNSSYDTEITKFDWNTSFAQPQQITQDELNEWLLLSLLQDGDKQQLKVFLERNLDFFIDYLLSDKAVNM